MNTLPAWQEFEMLTAEIQKQLAPYANVQHNHKVRGRSGRLRQLDVTVSQKIGPINVFMVFECKLYTSAVGIDKVEAFASKLKDVDASNGVMVSAAGFDGGAKSAARQHNIVLMTCREAAEVDWQKVVGIGAWFTFAVMAHQIISGTINFVHAEDDNIVYPLETKVYAQRLESNETYDEVGTIKSVATDFLACLDPPAPVGTLDVQLAVVEPLYVRHGEMWRQVLDMSLHVSVKARACSFNLRIAEGKVLERDGDTLYIQAASERFDWAEIMCTQPSTELTQEALEQLREHAPVGIQIPNLHRRQRFLRLVLTHKK